MAWDSSRPVPYRRLTKEWLIYAAIMLVVFVALFRDSTDIGGVIIGLFEAVTTEIVTTVTVMVPR